MNSLPSKTFLNISEEKRERFINAALEEFALYSYTNASLNRLVEVAEIAKGSIYQYFKNKKHLYEYLVDLSMKEKYTYISLNLNYNNSNINSIIADIFILGFKYDLQNPVKAKLIANTFNEKTTDELGSFPLSVAIMSDDYFSFFLNLVNQKSVYPSNIDIELTGFLLNRINLILPEYLEKKYNISYLELILDNSTKDTEKLKLYTEIVNKTLSLFHFYI